MSRKRKYSSVTAVAPMTNLILNIIVGAIAIACILPMIFVFMISISSQNAIALNGYRLIPSQFSIAGYQAVFSAGLGQLLQSYFISIVMTVVRTLLALIMLSLYAYAISRADFKFRRFFTWLAVVPMLFSGGLIPTYLINTQLLHFHDHFWALIIPGLFSTVSVLMLRTYFRNSIPTGLIEAARIDGAGEFMIFWRIVIPLSKPIIATIGLITAITAWNDWMTPLLYISKPSLTPLQFLLYQIQSNIQFMAQNLQSNPSLMALYQNLPTDAMQMAIVVLATLPIACAYPFFQRYFVHGLTIGGIKE